MGFGPQPGDGKASPPTAEEAATLFSKYDIALLFGNYGTQQLKALREAGADIGYIIPKEGALAWLDCWAVAPAADKAATGTRDSLTASSLLPTVELLKLDTASETGELPAEERRPRPKP